MQTSYAHDQTKRAYTNFVGQFDALTDADVRWTPYLEETLVFVLPRPALLDDDEAVAVRHVGGGVRRPQGAEAVRLLPGVACAYGAHCS
jgi:hypothetical protein